MIKSTLAGALAGCTSRPERKTAALEAYDRCMARITKHDGAVRAIIELNPNGRRIAAASDEQAHRSTLHGVPILLKDNIETADAMETTAGSLALLGAKPARDAFIVERLRAAGVVILGKTNLSEWANFRSPKSTSGWSARGHLTRNPHRLTHSASGSSSGSAAAVAAGFAPLAIGTETNGSIVSPASACGIVGLKPTVGLVSRSGIIPITHWQDTAGPMTRRVRDAAALLQIIAGKDERDPATSEARVSDYVRALEGATLKGKRLGVLRSLAGTHTGVTALFDQTLAKLRDAGAVIIDDVKLPGAHKYGGLSMYAMLVEFRQDLNAYLATRGAQVKSLAEVIAFNASHRAQELPHFEQEFFEQSESMSDDDALQRAKKVRETVRRTAREEIDAAIRDHQLDALVCATNDPTFPITLDKGDAHTRVCSTPAAVAGYPHLTVPMGFVDELPVGFSWMGTAWSEASLLSLGHAFEHLMPAFRPPAGFE